MCAGARAGSWMQERSFQWATTRRYETGALLLVSRGMCTSERVISAGCAYLRDSAGRAPCWPRTRRLSRQDQATAAWLSGTCGRGRCPRACWSIATRLRVWRGARMGAACSRATSRVRCLCGSSLHCRAGTGTATACKRVLRVLHSHVWVGTGMSDACRMPRIALWCARELTASDSSRQRFRGKNADASYCSWCYSTGACTPPRAGRRGGRSEWRRSQCSRAPPQLAEAPQQLHTIRFAKQDPHKLHSVAAVTAEEATMRADAAGHRRAARSAAAPARQLARHLATQVGAPQLAAPNASARAAATASLETTPSSIPSAASCPPRACTRGAASHR